MKNIDWIDRPIRESNPEESHPKSVIKQSIFSQARWCHSSAQRIFAYRKFEHMQSTIVMSRIAMSLITFEHRLAELAAERKLSFFSRTTKDIYPYDIVMEYTMGNVIGKFYFVHDPDMYENIIAWSDYVNHLYKLPNDITLVGELSEWAVVQFCTTDFATAHNETISKLYGNDKMLAKAAEIKQSKINGLDIAAMLGGENVGAR